MKHLIEHNQDHDGGFCCGIVEWGGFTDIAAGEEHYWEEETDDNDGYVFTKTFPEMWKAMLEHKAGQGFMNHIHFVRRKDYNGKLQKEYGWTALRDLVRKHPGVVHMGKFINPNTGNQIDSYCWSFPKDKEQ